MSTTFGIKNKRGSVMFEKKPKALHLPVIGKQFRVLGIMSDGTQEIQDFQYLAEENSAIIHAKAFATAAVFNASGELVYGRMSASQMQTFQQAFYPSATIVDEKKALR